MKNKKAMSFVFKAIIHLALIGLIIGLFVFSANMRINSKTVNQQILEKQIAILIEASTPGTTLIIPEITTYKEVQIERIDIKEGKVFVSLVGYPSITGYPYFTRYNLEQERDVSNHAFRIIIK